jgi:hypothetical protein
MGLAEVFQNAAITIHKSFGNIDAGSQGNATYHQKTGSPVYNPVTGTQTLTTTNIALPYAILVGYKSQEIDSNSIKNTDAKLLVPASSISFIPKRDDEVTVNGIKYEVIGIKLDPASAEYIIQLRPSAEA